MKTASRHRDKPTSDLKIVPYLEGVPIPDHLQGYFCFPGPVPDDVVIQLGFHAIGDKFFDYLLFVERDCPPYKTNKSKAGLFDPVTDLSDRVFEFALQARRPDWVLSHLKSFKPGAVDEGRLVEALFATDEEMQTASGLETLAEYFPNLKSQNSGWLVGRILQVDYHHTKNVEISLMRNGYGKAVFESRKEDGNFDWERLAEAAVSHGHAHLLAMNLAYCRGLSSKMAGALFIRGYAKQVYSHRKSFKNIDQVTHICAGRSHLVFPPDF